MTQAKMGIETLLRPAWNFECDYDQVGGDFPILFTWPVGARPALLTPDLSVIDDDARKTPAKPGVSPVLAKFVQAPPGATLLALFPVVTCKIDEPDRWAYVWRMVWRWRSAGDYVRSARRKGYLIGKTSFGAQDSRTTTVPNRNIPVGGERLVMPAASEAVIYAKTEPNPYVMNAPPAYGTLFHDAVSIPASFQMVARSPLYPGQFLTPGANFVHTMDYQQGVFDPIFPGIGDPTLPTSAFNPVTATHLGKWFKAMGNEFAVECYKFEYESPDNFQSYTPRAWDFAVDINGVPQSTGEDYPFSVMFGIGALDTPDQNIPIDTGVRVTVGAAPK